MTGVLRSISALAKCCSDGLAEQTESTAALPGARAAAGVPSPARPHLGQADASINLSCVHHSQPFKGLSGTVGSRAWTDGIPLDLTEQPGCVLSPPELLP